MPRIFFRYWLPVVLYAVLIFGISSIPGPNLPKNTILSDYILHVLEYLPFGFLIYRAVKNTKRNYSFWKVLSFSILLVFLYAASDEFHQLFIPGRYASLPDFLCDGIGSIIGMRIAA